jgi:uncharacterized protein (DUF1330 family)
MNCRTNLAAGIGLVAGLMMTMVPALHAQTQLGPAYIVVELAVEDGEGFAEYAEKATPTVAAYGGSFIVLAADGLAIEGHPPDGFVTILKFDSVNAARAWLTSPEYEVVKGIRHATARTRQYLVQGVDEY